MGPFSWEYFNIIKNYKHCSRRLNAFSVATSFMLHFFGNLAQWFSTLLTIKPFYQRVHNIIEWKILVYVCFWAFKHFLFRIFLFCFAPLKIMLFFEKGLHAKRFWTLLLKSLTNYTNTWSMQTILSRDFAEQLFDCQNSCKAIKSFMLKLIKQTIHKKKESAPLKNRRSSNCINHMKKSAK